MREGHVHDDGTSSVGCSRSMTIFLRSSHCSPHRSMHSTAGTGTSVNGFIIAFWNIAANYLNHRVFDIQLFCKCFGDWLHSIFGVRVYDKRSSSKLSVLQSIPCIHGNIRLFDVLKGFSSRCLICVEVCKAEYLDIVDTILHGYIAFSGST